MAQYIIPAIAGIIIAIIEFFAVRDRKSASKDREAVENAAIRAEESRLSMKKQDASFQLSIATANALTGDYDNGDVEKACIAAKEAEHEYNEFLQKVTAKEITK